MGDRSITIVKAGANIAACGVYTHWRGEESVSDLKDAIPRMRANDPDYSAARLIGELHAKMEGNSGLGVVPPPADLKPETLKEYTHGDAGVLVYDCETGELSAYAGYQERKLTETPWTPTKPPR